MAVSLVVASWALGVEVGDAIRIVVDTGGAQPVVLTGRLAGLVNEPIGTFAYLPSIASPLSRSLVEPAGSALLTFCADVDADAMRQRLTAFDRVAAVEVNEDFLQSFESYMAFFYVMIGFMIVFGAAMALALIYASISVDIAERSVEGATLRAEGVRQRVLSRLITAENLLVTVLGIPPGIALGLQFCKPSCGPTSTTCGASTSCSNRSRRSSSPLQSASPACCPSGRASGPPSGSTSPPSSGSGRRSVRVREAREEPLRRVHRLGRAHW